MNYKETMKYIKDTAKFGSNYGLERTEKILELLGNPHKKIKTIHVAGTNGKGSTTSMITSALMETGYKVGMYTSPFIQEFEERIQVNKKNIEKNKLAEVVTEVKDVVDTVKEMGFGAPTEFEIITCAMFLHFYYEKVDYAVIEVGLGGRLDSTNVIIPEVSVIASISYDHMNILGNTLEEIAYEKAGIIKEGISVITYPQNEEVMSVLNKVCDEKNCDLHKTFENQVKLINPKGENFTQEIEIKTDENCYKINLRLLGKHQLLNALLAVKTLEVIAKKDSMITKDVIVKGIGKATWMGRMEVMSKEPLVIIDGAHNIDGITKLSNSLREYVNYDKLVLIIGMLGDKQVDEMVNEITREAKFVVVTEPHNERAENVELLYDRVKDKNIPCVKVKDYEEAYKIGLSNVSENDLLLICGSLYMIGDMRKVIVG